MTNSRLEQMMRGFIMSNTPFSNQYHDQVCLRTARSRSKRAGFNDHHKEVAIGDAIEELTILVACSKPEEFPQSRHPSAHLISLSLTSRRRPPRTDVAPNALPAAAAPVPAEADL